MLQITNLSVHIQDKTIIKDISLQFEEGKNYCILGKNGSGKSSLALTCMGHPQYHIDQGDITIDGISIKDLDPGQRAKLWVFVAFQNIPEIKGVKLFEFLRSIYSAKVEKEASFIQFKKIIMPLVEQLQIDPEFLRRDVNVGFSWGEKRKIEILQLKLLEPKYIFLDEIDSWLDVDAFKNVATLMQATNTDNNCFIIITHYFSILEHIPIDRVYVLDNGQCIKQGDKTIADDIKKHWFTSLS